MNPDGWKGSAMRVLLDDHPIEVRPATIARAIEVGRDAAGARGRIVIEVLGDGASINPALLDDPPADSAGFVELKLVTADAGLFVSVTLTDALGVLDEIGRAQARAGEAILSGREEEALEPLGSALTGWGLIRDVVEKSSALLGLEPRAIEGGAEAIDALADRLSEIRRALTERDSSALGDVLAYDMPEQVERWRGLLSAMERRATGGRG